MSRSPFFYIEVYNRELGQWEKFDVYTKNYKDEIRPVDLWSWNGSHSLFSILEFETSYSDFPVFTALHKGLPIDVSNEMQKKFEEHCDDEINYIPDVHWFNLADALLYLRDNKTVEDLDAMEEEWVNTGVVWEDVSKHYMVNPLQPLIDRVNCFLELADDLRYWELSPSEVRIIGWVHW